jgi:hypothetical protein
MTQLTAPMLCYREKALYALPVGPNRPRVETIRARLSHSCRPNLLKRDLFRSSLGSWFLSV